jgi:hypothetical protein
MNLQNFLPAMNHGKGVCRFRAFTQLYFSSAKICAICGRNIFIRVQSVFNPWLNIGLLVLVTLLLGVQQADCADVSFTEYHVKALFLYNFAKYVDWPAETFSNTNVPITIGVLGQNNFGDDLTNAVVGKIINGRKIEILQIENESDCSKCQILFISNSQDARVADILSKIKLLPILTVGESDSFFQHGGIIHFALKDGKVRLEINLAAARASKVQISSKLLSVADVVKGKSN